MKSKQDKLWQVPRRRTSRGIRSRKWNRTVLRPPQPWPWPTMSFRFPGVLTESPPTTPMLTKNSEVERKSEWREIQRLIWNISYWKWNLQQTFGILAPRSRYCLGFLRKLTNSIISILASSQPATSLNRTTMLSSLLICLARLFPIPKMPPLYENIWFDRDPEMR